MVLAVQVGADEPLLVGRPDDFLRLFVYLPGFGLLTVRAVAV